jgi:hypothetical protein
MAWNISDRARSKIDKPSKNAAIYLVKKQANLPILHLACATPRNLIDKQAGQV